MSITRYFKWCRMCDKVTEHRKEIPAFRDTYELLCDVHSPACAWPWINYPQFDPFLMPGFKEYVFSPDPPVIIELGPEPEPVVSKDYEEGYFDGLRTAASTIKTFYVVHGDHYAAYYAPSTDAEELSKAILSLIPEGIR
jgi:hypothetical protein